MWCWNKPAFLVKDTTDRRFQPDNMIVFVPICLHTEALLGKHFNIQNNHPSIRPSICGFLVKIARTGWHKASSLCDGKKKHKASWRVFMCARKWDGFQHVLFVFMVLNEATWSLCNVCFSFSWTLEVSQVLCFSVLPGKRVSLSDGLTLVFLWLQEWLVWMQEQG